MTTYLSANTRDRARATYRATSHLEGDKSWSDFVERAILAEVERRELAHHAGERYEGDSSPLPVGRPLS
ncbi:ParB family protein [Cryobacterium zongtaii]|uniref:ParB family protein n=1 Tax=Cryobacterium zongtaii TaxID=1259217 RepID=UPI003CC694AC